MSIKSLPAPPYSAADVARMLHMDAKSVRTAILCGAMPGYRVGRNFIVPREAFERFQKGEWVPQPKPLRASDLIQRRRSA